MFVHSVEQRRVKAHSHRARLRSCAATPIWNTRLKGLRVHTKRVYAHSRRQT